MSDQVNARPTARVTKAASTTVSKAKDATRATTQATKNVTKQAATTAVNTATAWRLPDVGSIKLSRVHVPEVRLPQMSDLTEFAGRTTEQVKVTATSVRGTVAHTVTLVREAVGV